MAVYTIELRTLIQNNYPIFDNSWTTFVPEHKPELIDKIIRHYYFYEIGQETPDRFRHYINEFLMLRMPYYNQLYKSELLELQPLYDYMVEASEGTARALDLDRTVVGRKDDKAVRQMANSIKNLMDASGTMTEGVTGKADRTWNESTDGSKHVTTDQDTTDTKTAKETYTGKDDTVSKETFSENEAKVRNETMDDTLNGTKDTTGSSHTTGSATQRYSDTPQGRVGTSGVDIDKLYLTNYTANTNNEDVSTTGKETIQNTEKKVTDITDTTDTTHEKDDTTTVDKTYTKDNTENGSGTNDIQEDTTYSETKEGKENETSSNDTDQKTSSHSEGNTFSNGSETDQRYQTSAESAGTKEKEQVDTKIVSKGYHVAQAVLLKQYRDTFLNIDRMIIEDLAECFMGIF